jgi:hypothetical protein
MTWVRRATSSAAASPATTAAALADDEGVARVLTLTEGVGVDTAPEEWSRHRRRGLHLPPVEV